MNAKRIASWMPWAALPLLAVMALSGARASQSFEGQGEVTQGTLTIGGAPAPLLETAVEMEISAMIARVKVRQRFQNPGDAWAEGIYAFPLPDDAAVDRLRMRVGGRVIEGEIREKAEAKRIYVEAKQSGKRATLLSQNRPNLFTSSVANIDPRGEVTVEIEYQQQARYLDGAFELRFPMVVGPRYIPGTPLEESHRVSGGGWAMDTDQVPDASHITPPVAGPDEGPINPVTLDIRLRPGLTLAELKSRYHPVRIDREGEAYRIRLAEGPVPADRDFVLSWRPAPGSAPKAALFTEDAGGDERHLLLMVAPPGMEALAKVRRPRELIFVVDTSGSMHGPSIEQAKGAVALALDSLHPEDRFNLIQFNGTTSALFDGARPADGRHLARARGWLGGLAANGGTEMATALHAALRGEAAEGRLRQVLFLTDGAVGNEEALYRIIRERLGDSRLFTVGIGSAPNSAFMRRAALSGRGTFTHIGHGAEVVEKMSPLIAKLEYPALTSITVAVEGARDIGAELYPHPVPDLYPGEPLTVALRVDGEPRAITVSGEFAGRPWRSRIEVRPGERSPGVAVLWARRKIESLLERHGEAREMEARANLRDQVVATALKHHLVSRFTSLVAVDKTPVRPGGEALKSHAMKTNLPAGWSHEKVFGMARTATPAALHLLIGSLLLGLAGLLRFWRAV